MSRGAPSPRRAGAGGGARRLHLSRPGAVSPWRRLRARSAPAEPRSCCCSRSRSRTISNAREIVRSSENYRLAVMSNDWWGEPLGAMLSRVLVEELGQRLPQSTVIAENGAVSARPDATLELNIERLDEDAAGNLILQAQVAVRFTGQASAGAAQLPLQRAAAGAGCAGRGRGDQRRGRPARRRDRANGGRGRCGGVKRRSPSPPATLPQLRECPGCGLLQMVPALHPGTTAQCARCPTILRRASAHRLDHIIALTVAALVLLAVMCTTALMSVQTAGIRHVADLFSGPAELVAAKHGAARRGRAVRDRAGAVRQAGRHALRADPRP